MLSYKYKDRYINRYDAIVGNNELEGNISKKIKTIDNYYYGEKTFEQSQIKMQKEIINNLLTDKTKLIVGGDLSNQIGLTSYALCEKNISFLGIYSACASFVEGLIIGEKYINDNTEVLVLTSNHNLVSERQFRFPIEYANLRNVNSTFTSTCATGCVISNEKSNIKLVSSTIGRVINLNISDPNLIGAIMAPAAAEAIYEHLVNNSESLDDYDLILTGDLGNVGLMILKDYLKEEYNIVTNKIIDAGSNLYKKINEINDGASGPATLPLYLFYNIIDSNKYKKILVVGTGSLHSRTIVNQKLSIPSVAHVISIEVVL
ncbi:MAG: hypothetical protein K6G37_02250 [Bacilli bacterium]|nr:hypothetical protein [Bacilli bacterium]